MPKRCKAHQKINCTSCERRATFLSDDDSLFVDTTDYSSYDSSSSSCDTSSSDSGSSSCD